MINQIYIPVRMFCANCKASTTNYKPCKHNSWNVLYIDTNRRVNLKLKLNARSNLIWTLIIPHCKKLELKFSNWKLSIAMNGCTTLINSLAPGKFEWHFRYIIFQIISVIDGWGISWELALRWMSLHLTDKPTLVQVMAWCCQATSHYLSQWWPRYLSPYGVTRPQWVHSWWNEMIYYGNDLYVIVVRNP